MKTTDKVFCDPCSGSGRAHSIFDFCNCEPECTTNNGLGTCENCKGTGKVNK